jgi:hypothetical protein
MILGHDSEALDRFSDKFTDLPNWRPQIAERAHVLKAELADLARSDAETRREIDERIAAFNTDWRELDRLISAQFWRVAFFRVAADEINYRRFFDINDLAALRMELAPVFEHAHAQALRMLESGEIDGLRIDHVDSLFDPKSYLTALRERAERPFYLVVEKILAAHERLRADWPVEGTTGYDYLNLSLGLLIDPAAESDLSDSYRGFAGATDSFEAITLASKLRIMDNEMASELGSLGRAATRLARRSPMTADLTRAILTRAIKAIVACFPVYRTYLDLSGAVGEADRRDTAWAVTRARRFDPDVHASAFDFLERLLTGDAKELGASEIGRTAARRFAMKAAAVHRAGDGEGRRGHRLLPLQSICRPERSRRRAGQVRRSAVALPQSQRAARGALAARNARDRYARHETRRGCAREARSALGSPGGMAASGHKLESACSGEARRRRRQRTARSRRRIHVLPDAGRLVAIRAPRGADGQGAGRLSNPSSWGARKGVAGGQATLELGGAQPRIRSGDARVRPRSVEGGGRIPHELPAVCRTHCPARRAEQPRPDGAEAHGAGRP